MLQDPMPVKIGSADPVQLSRLATGDTSGHFLDPSGKLEILVYPRVTKAGRSSNLIQLRQTKVTTDPLVSTTNIAVQQSVSVGINRPSEGFSQSETVELFAALASALTGSNNATLMKLINGES